MKNITKYIYESQNKEYVDIFVVYNDKILFLRRANYIRQFGGKWCLPGGTLEKGEDQKEAIIRELKEEIGINVKQSELKLVKTIKKQNVFRDVYILKRDIPLEDFKLDKNEVMDCKYVTIDEFKEMIERGECTFTSFEQTIFYDNKIDF